MSQNIYDQSYRRLFSSPYMVRALFEGILPDALREQLDLDTLTPLPTNFTSLKNIDRRADCIWQVCRHDGVMLYLLILLEHQSRPERIMSVRFMGYAALLYEYLALNGRVQVAQGLPVLLFRLEHNQGLEQAVEMLQTVLRLTRGAKFTELRTAFFHWVRTVLLPRSLPAELTGDLAQAKDFSELTTMMTTHRKNWGDLLREEGELKGRQEGRQEGLQQGVLQGAAATLSTLIAHRFGEVPAWAAARLEHANDAELKGWTLKILDAQRVEDIFV